MSLFSRKMNQLEQDDQDQDQDRFLLFTLGEDLFAVRLLEVGEVIESVAPQAMPNTVSHFMGLINVRGQLYGVIDLRLKFGIRPGANKKREVYLLFKNQQGNFALIVDSAKAVISIDASLIDTQPHVLSQRSTTYLAGVAKINERLISILKLNELLEGEQLLAYNLSSFSS